MSEKKFILNIHSLLQPAFKLCVNILVGQPRNAFSRNDHDIGRFRKHCLVQSEELSQKTLDSVSFHSVSGFFANCGSQSFYPCRIAACNNGKISGVEPVTLIVDAQVVLPLPDPLFWLKRLRFHVSRPFGRRGPFLNRQSFTAFGASAAKDVSAALGGHAHQKAMGAFSFGIAERGQCLFHFKFSRSCC